MTGRGRRRSVERATGTGGATSESVLSDSNALRRQFRVASSRNVRHASPESAVDFAPCVLDLDEAEKPAKAKGFLSPSETDGFASRS